MNAPQGCKGKLEMYFIRNSKVGEATRLSTAVAPGLPAAARMNLLMGPAPPARGPWFFSTDLMTFHNHRSPTKSRGRAPYFSGSLREFCAIRLPPPTCRRSTYGPTLHWACHTIFRRWAIEEGFNFVCAWVLAISEKEQRPNQREQRMIFFLTRLWVRASFCFSFGDLDLPARAENLHLAEFDLRTAGFAGLMQC